MGYRALCRLVGVDDLDDVVAQCRRIRRGLGLPTARWNRQTLAGMLRLSVIDQRWPAAAAIPALLAMTADPATHSPARLSAPGPWWDAAESAERVAAATSQQDAAEMADGRRVWAQREARRQLADGGEPITRLSVARRASALLEDAVREGQRS